MFHARDIKIADLPSSRKSNQTYIHFDLESPVVENKGDTTVLCTVLYCIVLCTVLHYSVLYFTVPYCIKGDNDVFTINTDFARMFSILEMKFFRSSTPCGGKEVFQYFHVLQS